MESKVRTVFLEKTPFYTKKLRNNKLGFANARIKCALIHHVISISKNF